MSGRATTTVFLISAATLAYEILLVRAFAIQYFSHFAFMAIGVAMLGNGVVGVLLAHAGPLDPTRARRWLVGATLLTAVSLIASPAAVDRVALEPMQLLWDQSQWLRLGAVYVLLALPFGAGALVVLLALTIDTERTGRLYGASFLGAALGATSALAITAVAMPDRALSWPALVAAVGTVAAFLSERRTGKTVVATGGVLIAAVLASVWPPWRIEVSPLKALPQVAAYPDAQIVHQEAGAAGWVTAVRASAFRYAPGLSIGYRGSVPSQLALFVDGSLVGAASNAEAGDDFYDWLPTAAAYAFGARRRVLVLGAGGGSEVQNAIRHGAAHVTAVESHRAVAKLIREASQPDTGAAVVEWVTADARSFVAGTADEFDVVTIQPTGGLGGNAGGVHSLNEDFTHTVDAYLSYLQVLAPAGVVTVTRWLSLPPRETVRMILTAGEAVREAGADPNTSMLVIRSWATVTVVLKREPLTRDEVADIHAWAERRGFDLDWYPDIAAPGSRFHMLDDPVLHRAARAVARSVQDAAAFSDAYPFDVSPVTDARPYPGHFLRFGGLATVLRSGPGQTLPFTELGIVAVVATLVQSITLGALLLIVPAGVGAIRRGRAVPARLLLFFSTIGMAYMVAEIAAIQQLTLLLGQPQYAVTTVLATFLICSGLGSVWSDRLSTDRGWLVASVLAGLFIFYALVMLPVVQAIQPATFLVRVVVSLLLIGLPATLMGMPFPVGLRHFAGVDSSRRAWAWAGNGFASVVATPLAALIALELGSPVLFLVAAVAYGVAAWSVRSFAATRAT